jgi:hypothetical protein
MPASRPIEADRFALPVREGAPVTQTLLPCSVIDAALSRPAAIVATVVLATLNVAAPRVPLTWMLAFSGSVA